MSVWNDAGLARSELRERKRDALVRQAALEFRRRGYHSTSMDDIAAALGVTKGALYRYVKSKDEVLFECFVHSNDIGTRALDHAEQLQATAAEKLRAFMVAFIREYLDSNMAGGAMVEIDALMPEQRAEVVKGRDKIDHRLRTIIEQGFADGSLAQASPKLIIFTFMGAINWIPSWYSPDKEWTSIDIAHQVADIILAGVRKR